jgi:amino acid transporter
MKTRFLFPHRCKAIGWIFFVPSAAMLLIFLLSEFDFQPSFFDAKVLSLFPSEFSLPGVGEPAKFKWAGVVSDNIFNELMCIVCIVSGIFIAFSREKNEDEFIGKLRLESLVWATYVSYAIQLFCVIFFYEMFYCYALMVNIFTLLLVFIVRFNLVLFKLKRQNHEE